MFFGDKNGKYPDANQVIVRGSDTQAAFDTPIVANHIGAEFDATDLVILGHVHEDHMAALHRLPKAPVHVHVADLPAAQSWAGLVAAYGSDESYVAARCWSSFSESSSTRRGPTPSATRMARCGTSADRACAPSICPAIPPATACCWWSPKASPSSATSTSPASVPITATPHRASAIFAARSKRVADIPAKVWVTSHHRGVYTDREHFLRDLAAYTKTLETREQRLLELLRASPKTLEQLVECRLLYPPGHQDFWVVDAETRSISRHLDEMLADGRVKVDDDGVYRLG